mmetsp:Transcript_27371/g.52114  ORF Transcript_27371/g.52114 Transcript_27371/m.52114 type:complete len:355 (+) Transcript_27371:371-1435(+)|eukprot:CAMPEP_0114240940 /NCGR_PEP_ID=MMETSP0058-20121206/9372_1 /TAXON_ID=36894 /ORGANISM="Pyramimonas parkeae, CCMP726" /LENGTH=354 /DNA_ID=CAMNT_0001353443 /DNA_START=298 /DNA_END=1362 /DNA_ORIENTATION=+
MRVLERVSPTFISEPGSYRLPGVHFNGRTNRDACVKKSRSRLVRMAYATPQPLRLTAELVVDCRNILGEGLVWCEDAKRLIWVDIEGKLLLEFDPSCNETRTWSLPERPGSVALKQGGGFIFAFENGLSEYDLDTGVLRRLAPFEPEHPTTRMNDGRCDYQGRFVVGGYNEMHRSDGARALSGVYRLDPSRPFAPERILDEGVRVANSLCFSTDGKTMYFCDSPTRRIHAYDYSNGLPSNKRLFYEIPEAEAGFPDGATVDSEDAVWSAQFGAGRVVRIRRCDAAVDIVVDVPVPNPTCVALGGPDMNILYITTTRRKMSDEELESVPTAGSLFAVKVPVKGVGEPKFGSGSSW